MSGRITRDHPDAIQWHTEDNGPLKRDHISIDGVPHAPNQLPPPAKRSNVVRPELCAHPKLSASRAYRHGCRCMRCHEANNDRSRKKRSIGLLPIDDPKLRARALIHARLVADRLLRDGIDGAPVIVNALNYLEEAIRELKQNEATIIANTSPDSH